MLKLRVRVLIQQTMRTGLEKRTRKKSVNLKTKQLATRNFFGLCIRDPDRIRVENLVSLSLYHTGILIFNFYFFVHIVLSHYPGLLYLHSNTYLLRITSTSTSMYPTLSKVTLRSYQKQFDTMDISSTIIGRVWMIKHELKSRTFYTCLFFKVSF